MACADQAATDQTATDQTITDQTATGQAATDQTITGLVSVRTQALKPQHICTYSCYCADMRLFIGYPSALYFWLRGSQGLWPVEPCATRALSQAAFNESDVQSFSFPHDAFGPEPLHLMVDSPSKRRLTPHQKCLVWSYPLARNSFVPIGHNVFVASPALCFLQAAKALPFFDLVELGYEICGSYSRTPGIGKGYFQRSYQLATRQSIDAYIQSVHQAQRKETALRALRYVLDNSASPPETDMAVKLFLPQKYGGYNFPLGELNPEIVLTDEAAAIAHRSKAYPDIFWRGQRACLEYDSAVHHEGSRERTRDSLKRNALGCMGYKVITVTPLQLKNVIEFHGVATELAKYLGKRIKPDSERTRQARFELNAAINERMDKDLTPTEWPYV